MSTTSTSSCQHLMISDEDGISARDHILNQEHVRAEI